MENTQVNLVTESQSLVEEKNEKRHTDIEDSDSCEHWEKEKDTLMYDSDQSGEIESVMNLDNDILDPAEYDMAPATVTKEKENKTFFKFYIDKDKQEDVVATGGEEAEVIDQKKEKEYQYHYQ